MGDTVAFRLDLEGPVILNPSASALPLTAQLFPFSQLLPSGPQFFFFFFFEEREEEEKRTTLNRKGFLSSPA